MDFSKKSTTVLGVIGDIFIVLLIGVSSILMRQLATPFHRGFFKDDESLMYPFKDSTIPASVLYGVGFCLPCLVILINEGLVLRRQKQGDDFVKEERTFTHTWMWRVYKIFLMFWFGVVVTHFSTNIPKYTIGRLRPHFFAVCVPDIGRVSQQGYIEDDICTGNDTDLIKEARVSFPSGHSSMAIYCMLFLVLYLEKRFIWQGMLLLKSFLQTLFTLMGVYTCLSRVSDYKHHWSDVLAGGLLGAIITLFVFWSLEKHMVLKGMAKNPSEQELLKQSGTARDRPSSRTSSPPRHEITAF